MTLRRPLYLGIVLLNAGLAAAASGAQPRMPAPDLRTLLVVAIDAPDGRAQGTLTGPLADAITRRFHATAPIHVDVTTQRRYRQAFCSRLLVRIWQDGVQFPRAPEARRQTVDIGINYCRDGSPPKSLS